MKVLATWWLGAAAVLSAAATVRSADAQQSDDVRPASTVPPPPQAGSPVPEPVKTVARAKPGTVSGSITVSRAKGSQAGDVLVYLVGFSEKPLKADITVKQQGQKFVPDLVALPAGGTLSFPNGDPFLHNVFSPTADRKFDLGSFKKGETRTRTFPNPGVIEIYCNIHPDMSALLLVLPNNKFTKAAANGSFTISDVPKGTWTVFAVSRRASKPVSAKVTVDDSGSELVNLTLEEVAKDFSHKNKYGESYRKSSAYPSR